MMPAVKLLLFMVGRVLLTMVIHVVKLLLPAAWIMQAASVVCYIVWCR
jgi:hypothetical protein